MNKTIKLLEVFNSNIPNKTCNLAVLPIRPCERAYLPAASLSVCYNCVFNTNNRNSVKTRIKKLAEEYEQSS